VPLYEYVCANGHSTDVMHGVHDTGPDRCPVCGATIRKAFVAPTIHFKGSGWAKKDRRSSGSSKKSTGEGGSGGDTGGSDGGPAKPAAESSTGASSPSTSSSDTDSPKKSSGATD
jgi:putative FmdB family regulatory protein